MNVKKEVNFELFRYPTRLHALVIVFCTKGSFTFTVGLSRYTMSENMMFVFLPGSILHVETECEASAKFIICEEDFISHIQLDIKLLSHMLLSVDKSPALHLSSSEMAQMERSLDEILSQRMYVEDEHYSADICSQEILSSMVRTLAYKICRCIGNHVLDMDQKSVTSSRSRSEEYFNQFMNILSKNYMTERTVGFYAKQLHLTPKYLTTVIRQTSGRTVIEWIDDYVVLEAKNLLKYSSMNIQQIAYTLNFPNQSFFGKYFKNHTGISPSAYRLGK